MAIEFSCPHCQHLLRTADDKAGLSAKCPACSEVIWVPYSTDSDASESAASAPEATESADPPEPDAAPQEIGIPLAKEPGPDPLDELASASADDATGANETPQDIPRRRSAPEIVCPGCQATNEPGTQNCRFCGTSLEGVEPVEPSQQATVPRTPEVGEAMSTAWRIYSENLGLLIGSTLLALPLGSLAVAVALLPVFGLVAAFGEVDGDMAIVGGLFGSLCSLPLLAALLVPVAIGVTQLTLKLATGKHATISDLFCGFEREGRALIPGMAIVMLVVLIASAIPFGIGTMLIWPLTYMYVHERNPLGDTFTPVFQSIGRRIRIRAAHRDDHLRDQHRHACVGVLVLHWHPLCAVCHSLHVRPNGGRLPATGRRTDRGRPTLMRCVRASRIDRCACAHYPVARTANLEPRG